MKMAFRLLVVFLFLFHVGRGMYHKRQLPEDDPRATHARQLRSEYDDLFLGNTISGTRAHRLYDLNAKLGVKHMKKRAKASKDKKHACRNLMRQITKGSMWPPVYAAWVDAYNPKTQKAVRMKLYFLLPHEVVYLMAAHSSSMDLEAFYDLTGLSQISRENLRRACQELGEPRLLPLGVWGDGIPCNWDRTQSIELIAWSMPGLVDKLGQMRIPFTAINQKFMLKKQNL